jgi:hypothetical protein
MLFILDMEEAITISIILEKTGTPALESIIVLGTGMRKTIRTQGGREKRMISSRWAVGTITQDSLADTSTRTIRINPHIEIIIRVFVNSRV